jgi:transposase-like protein
VSLHARQQSFAVIQRQAERIERRMGIGADPPPLKWSALTCGFEPEEDRMARKHHKPEAIVAKLRQVDVLLSQGQAVADAIRAIGVSEVTYYRWRQEFGGLKSDQVKRLKALEQENARLRRAVSDLTLDKQILAEAARGSF